MYRIGIDTGGTNTDLVLTNVETGAIYSAKTATTPEHLIDGIFTGIEKICGLAGITPEEIKELVYGTTIVVNMIAQKENEAVALITTKGFRDVLEIGRAWRDKQIYNNFLDKPEPLVRRELRFEVAERINFQGEIVEQLDESGLPEIVAQLKEKNIRSVAVCLLHSYRNPAHEQQIKAYLLRELPELYVSISAEINPQFREYERTSTTVLNAYMMPNMISHIEEFNGELERRNIRANTYMMNANAGIMSFESAKMKPVTVSDSGPIGGIIAANHLGKLMGSSNLITFDMGGTSCDVSLIQHNQIQFRTDSHIEGYPINIPTVDLDFIGAGGGSIAWYDKGGALKVGPISAGAKPGPICYRRGGTLPTVTDANFVLGRIRPELFLEDLSDVMEKTKQAILEKIAQPLGLSLYEAAEGIIEVVNANMIRAIKFVSVQKGYDPRDFALVSFGGAGGLHAAKLAGELDIPRVIVPYSPGTFAAMGQVLADIKHDFVHTDVQEAAQVNPSQLNRIFSQLESQGIAQLQVEGVAPDKQLLVRSCELRYLGQAFELNVPVQSGEITEETIAAMIERFHNLHEQTYGHSLRGDQVEFVNYRVSAIGMTDTLDLARLADWDTGSKVVEQRIGEVVFDGKTYTVPVYDRNQLHAGFSLNEPAIIGEMGATTVIYPGQSLRVDEYRSLIIETNANKGAK
ncbi:MAG: hydantoinase/oxoprolinase family protein [Clostridia bacterium]